MYLLLDHFPWCTPPPPPPPPPPPICCHARFFFTLGRSRYRYKDDKKPSYGSGGGSDYGRSRVSNGYTGGNSAGSYSSSSYNSNSATTYNAGRSNANYTTSSNTTYNGSSTAASTVVAAPTTAGYSNYNQSQQAYGPAVPTMPYQQPVASQGYSAVPQSMYYAQAPPPPPSSAPPPPPPPPPGQWCGSRKTSIDSWIRAEVLTLYLTL